MTIYNKERGNENSDSSNSSKSLDCDCRDLKLKEAEKTIANKDVIICMLQSQVKKLEESYKQNVKQAEDFRFRYCIAVERIKRMQCGSDKNKQQKNSKKDGNVPVCEECPLPEEVNQCNTAFIKSHYVALQALVDEILEKKQQCKTGNQSSEADNAIQQEMKNNISELQREIDQLKNENAKLKEQIEKIPLQLEKESSITECLKRSNTSLKEKISELDGKFASKETGYNSKKNSIDEEILLTSQNYDTKDLNSVISQEDNHSLKAKIEQIRSRQSLMHAVDSAEYHKKRLSYKDESVISTEDDDVEKHKKRSIIMPNLKKEHSKYGNVSFHDFPNEIIQLDSITENQETEMADETLSETVDDKEEPIEVTPRSGTRCCFEEVTDRINLLVEKQEFTHKELEEVKREIGNTRACTENCNDEILNMKELVCTELKELRGKIELLLENAGKVTPQDAKLIDKEDDKITKPEILPDDVAILEEKYSEMKKQAIEKDQQIQCLNKLVTYYNSLNEEVLCFCPTDSPRPVKNCECSDRLPEKPITPEETPKTPNEKTKPTTPKGKPVSGKNTNKIRCKQTEKCKCPSGKKCRKDETQPDDDKNILDVKSSTHIRIIKPCKGSEINKKLSIEDIYQAVRCSRRHKKKTARPDCDCISSVVSSASVGNCLPNCEGCVCVGSLETYVNYLHEQLQVISTIENQIENLRDDMKFPH